MLVKESAALSPAALARAYPVALPETEEPTWVIVASPTPSVPPSTSLLNVPKSVTAPPESAIAIIVPLPT